MAADARRPKMPPALLAVLCGGLMWVLARYGPGWQVTFAARAALAAALLIAGSVTLLFAVLAFRRADTTLNPLAPERAEALVVSGLFRVSRNPMYVGMLLVLAAIALYLAQPLNLLVLVWFVWAINAWQIKPEEQALRDRFGDDYLDYCTRVRRWL